MLRSFQFIYLLLKIYYQNYRISIEVSWMIKQIRLGSYNGRFGQYYNYMINLKLAFILILITLSSSRIDNNTDASVELLNQQQNTPLDSNSTQTRYIKVEEQYTFKLKPKSSLILIPNSTIIANKTLFMDYISTFPFQSCIVNQKQQCKSQKINHKIHEGTMSINQSIILNGILFQNPHETLYIRLQVLFYYIDKDCNPLAARQLYRKQLSTQLCFTHQIQQEKDLQILLQSEAFMNLKYYLAICNIKTPLQLSQNNRFLINNSAIAQKCNGQSLKQLTIKIVPDNITSISSNDTQITYVLILLQYPQEAILLPDGIGYTTTLKGSTPKLFYFELINTLSTTINVESKSAVEIYAKIVDEAFVEDTIPSKQDNHFSSQSTFIFLYFKPFLTITTDEILQYKCQNCFLVVSVYLSKEQKNSNADITVQIVQHHSILSTGIAKHNYLPKDSTSFYKYVSNKPKMIYIQISDNNHYCSRVYFGTNQNPSESDHLLKYEKKQIVYMTRKDEVYYLAVQALANCPFSIVIYDSTNNITYLEKGRFGFLNLETGMSRVYLIKADDSQYLKFLSVHVYGSVEIYLNRTSLQYINTHKNYDFNFSSFQKKGQYSNSLILDKQDKIFCKRCYYLVGIFANKHTQSSLFYGDQTTPIPIRDKVVNDFIPKKGAVVLGEYYGGQKSSFQLTVRSGQLRLNFHNDKKKYERTFQMSQDQYNDTFNLEIENKNILDRIVHFFTQEPIKVTFQALQDNTIYTLKVKELQAKSSQDQPKIKYKNVSVTAGDDLYQMVTPEMVICVSGYLRDKSERIILTSDYNSRDKLSLLKVSAQINDKKVQVNIQRAQNILSISFPSLTNYLMNSAVQFDLFLSIQNSKLWLFIMQDEQFTLLSSQADVLIQNQYTFITHAQSDLIIDIFQCNGKSSILYSSSRKDLQYTKQKDLDIIGLSNQPHAARISRYSTTFFKVTAPKAILRWFPIDIEEHVGTGYMDYEVGHLIYKSVFNGVQLSWNSLAITKRSSSIISNISYHLFVSPYEDSLKASSQCQLEGANVFRLDNIIDPQNSLVLSTNHTYKLDRNTLTQQFSSISLFVTIIADVTLTPNMKKEQNYSTERYRFFYPIIQIPQQLFAASYLDKISALTISQISTLVLLSIVLITILAYICLKKIMPLLGVLKNRWLVEQQNEDNAPPGTEANQGLTQVPPSSDRKGIHANHQLIEKDEYIEVK